MFDKTMTDMARLLSQNAFVRVVNYHNTLKKDAARFETEIAYFAEHFSPVTIADVDQLFATGRWHKEKPGLIPAVFEGYRGHHDVYAPLLEKYDFVGWFYVPSYFMDVPVPQQGDFCKSHRLRNNGAEDYADGRFALTWDEMRTLSKKHEICCHTATHFCLDEKSSDEEMRREIVGSKRKLEQELDKPIDVFCWLGGKDYNDYPESHPYLKEAGYRYLVGNLKLQKIG